MLFPVLIHLRNLSWECWASVCSGFSPSLPPLRACLCGCVNSYLKKKWHLIQSFLPNSAGVALELMPQLGVVAVGALNPSEMVGQKSPWKRAGAGPCRLGRAGRAAQGTESLGKL